MESTNSWGKGINLDINDLNQPPNTYREAENVRIMNDVGGTSVSLNNILGNDYKISIPDTLTFQKISITGTAATFVTINGQTGSSAYATSGGTAQTLYDHITTDPNFTLDGVQYDVYYGDSYLVIVPKTGFTVTISVSTPSLTVDSNFVPAQSNLEIIGSVNIRDDIYLFTTSNKTKNPGGHDPNNSTVDASSVGQIWKFEYDKVSLSTTLTLIYNNYLDFSTYWHIPPTAVVGRYENSGVQRIYWTDNFNKLRSLNVADPMVIALDITLVDVTPAVDYDVMIMQDIHNAGGSVEVGCYQVAYRLKNTSGAVTTFSELSNMIFVVPENESDNTNGDRWKFYIGANEGTTTAKAITWKVKNLDTDFDRIEVALVKRTGILDPGEVKIIADESLNGNDFFQFTYDGTTPASEIPITLSEFLSLSGVFTHCKTIGTKDNRLFAANVRKTYSDLDYDARAFRAKTSGADDIYLTNNGVETLYNSTTAAALDETEDTINNYSSANAGYYKPNTAILGGAGTNISYEFYTVAIAADKNVTTNFNIPDFTPAPWRSTSQRYDLGTLNLNVFSPTNLGGTDLQEYPLNFPNQINDDIKYPQMNSLFRGYQRNEIYRFGIQFFDKSKNPFFVKWIGDIKFPDFNDSNPNSFHESGASTGITDFRPSFVANIVGYDEVFIQQLGVRFSVDIPADISQLIDGYTIVRTERTEQDTTVVSEGYVCPALLGPDGNYYTTSPAVSFSGNSPNAPTVRGWYATPNNGVWTQPDSTMTLNIKGIVRKRNTTINVNFGTANGNYNYFKYYDWISTSQYSLGLDQMDLVPYGSTVVDTVSGTTAFNMDYDVTGVDVTVSHSIGNEAFYFIADGNVNYLVLAGADIDSKLLCTIERSLPSQYGGNTYTNRSKNDYISCNHFRPIRTSVSDVTDTFQIFGGDTFVNMWDSTRWAANFQGYTNRGQITPYYSVTFFLPCESKMNKALEHGSYMNRMAPGNADIEMREDKNYNTIFSAENNVRKFFPKPDPFVANEEFDTRFWASQVKINGELVDSWGIFQANNYWDTEGTYGPINAMRILKDKMYFWQDRAFGTMSINPRVIVTNETDGTSLQVGTGNVLQRHDYLSTEVGLQHQWGLTWSSYKLFWIDVNTKKFYNYGEGQAVTPDSDIKGLSSWFVKNLKYNINNIDKPVYSDVGSNPVGLNGIRAVYDFKYNQAVFTISDGRNLTSTTSFTNSYTLAFDERLDCFTSFYSFTPKVYFTDGYKIFSTNPNNLDDIYMHDTGDYCKFYGVIYPSKIKLVSNHNPKATKVFDNIVYDSQALKYDSTLDSYTNYNDDTWNTIRVYNDYQNSDFQTLTVNSNIKRKERSWQLAVPRNRVLYTTSNSPNIFDPVELSPTNKTYGERMRDGYLTVDLIYNNQNNRLLTTNNIVTLYRESAR